MSINSSQRHIDRDIGCELRGERLLPDTESAFKAGIRVAADHRKKTSNGLMTRATNAMVPTKTEESRSWGTESLAAMVVRPSLRSKWVDNPLNNF